MKKPAENSNRFRTNQKGANQSKQPSDSVYGEERQYHSPPHLDLSVDSENWLPPDSRIAAGGNAGLLELDWEAFASFFGDLNLPEYRARQVWRWIYRSYVLDFAAMTDLPHGLREKLASLVDLRVVRVLNEKVSSDGLTTKILFGLTEEKTIEAVFMRYGVAEEESGRRTVCVSTQIGCPIGCVFCATGHQGFARNLSVGEIVAQVLHFASVARLTTASDITNVVFMGQGEPLLNFPAVWSAVERLNDPRAFGLGARHMTISTAGIVPGIRLLATKPLQVGLAISLHTANNQLRDRLVPLNRRYPLGALIPACREYATATGRRVTFEYALIDGVNDGRQEARELTTLLKGMLAHVNLIPLNTMRSSRWQPSPPSRVRAFQAELQEHGVPVTVRVRRGDDIEAACGQLQSKGGSELPVLDLQIAESGREEKGDS